MNHVAAIALGLSILPAQTALAQADFRTYDARTFYETTTIFGGSFSHDETRLLITTDATGIFNAYAQPVDGGEPKQLTHSGDDAIFAVSWFPEDDRFVFTKDQGGNELNHLFVQTPDGTQTDLTPGEGHRAGFAGWKGDFTAFYVVSNERDNRAMDVYRYDINTYDRELIYENTEGYAPAGGSRDGRWVALAKIRNNADDNIYLFDLENPSADLVHVTPHEGDVSHGVQGFAPDSSRLFYTSNQDSEFARLWSYDLASGATTLEEGAEWDIVFMYHSWNGRYRVRGINADARTEITVTDTTTARPLRLPDIPRGDVTGVSISRSEKLMAFYVNGDTSPSNLYVMGLESGEHRRLTQSLNPAINERHLVESEVVRYPSFDGLEIPALLYKPRLATEESPAPALVWVHGGPGGQSTTGYRGIIQFLVNHGYAVLAVNNRGSSGYGKTFFHMDDRKHGDVDLKDCVWARKYLETLDWVDSGRIGIIGGSYGGYMVAAALAFEPEVFDVGVDIFGVTNWLRTLKSIPPWWADFKEALYAEMGDPEEDEQRLRRISPLFHAQNITKPMLVVQGANDPRVLKVESDEIVEAARNNGVPVEYVVFDDEGHGFSNKENRIEFAEASLSFLDRYLRGAETQKGGDAETPEG